MKIQMNLEEYVTNEDDVANLECELCDRACQKAGEIWWETNETKNNIMSFCDDCVKELAVDVNVEYFLDNLISALENIKKSVDFILEVSKNAKKGFK